MFNVGDLVVSKRFGTGVVKELKVGGEENIPYCVLVELDIHNGALIAFTNEGHYLRFSKDRDLSLIDKED